jgi:hypothetical protein
MRGLVIVMILGRSLLATEIRLPRQARDASPYCGSNRRCYIAATQHAADYCNVGADLSDFARREIRIMSSQISGAMASSARDVHNR